MVLFEGSESLNSPGLSCTIYVRLMRKLNFETLSRIDTRTQGHLQYYRTS